jgi:antitoxin CptB
MNNNIDDLKKKIIYRSIYRGTKEMDTLLSSFTKMYIDTFNDKDLFNLSDLLNLDDDSLYKYYQNNEQNDKIKINKVTELFKNFKYKKE